MIRVLKRGNGWAPTAGSRVRPSVYFGDLTYQTLTRILDRGLEAEASHPHRSRTGLNVCPDRRRAPG